MILEGNIVHRESGGAFVLEKTVTKKEKKLLLLSPLLLPLSFWKL